ncbi:uncharacterized protein LACBIDRAFT_314705 [Laccaria bicolor S238N-H82]|uniref:Predicted protein n=1 Tax=Laccaria bicolor (strain S238N-H82 / ATCC MYA-4686) TaxID=486041 RepID=B0DZ24_LACBS|nr:uncharacterized protein LACBIDRAFT_314705 [Laccaria bicolor S238N-H82]EDR00158.1 predicted protein [Laccaria bicolor S238N-H82]|eukprot:XP_001889215.1 predicted protein [Laccaria bicolor S238N-H82]
MLRFSFSMPIPFFKVNVRQQGEVGQATSRIKDCVPPISLPIPHCHSTSPLQAYIRAHHRLQLGSIHPNATALSYYHIFVSTLLRSSACSGIFT